MRRLLATAVAGLAALSAAPAGAQSPGPRVEIGILTCSVAPGIGLVVGSKREMSCVLTRAAGYPDRYVGAITKLGLDGAEEQLRVGRCFEVQRPATLGQQQGTTVVTVEQRETTIGWRHSAPCQRAHHGGPADAARRSLLTCA